MCKECENVVVVINIGLDKVSNANTVSDKFFIYNIDENIFATVHHSEYRSYQGRRIWYCPFCGEELIAEKCVKDLEEVKKRYKEKAVEVCMEEIKMLQQYAECIENKEMEVLLDKNKCLKKIEKLKTKLGKLNV